MSWMTIVGMVLVVIFITPVIIIYRITNIKLFPGKTNLVDPNAIPIEQKTTLKSGEEIIQSLGFTSQGNVLRGRK